jgi:BolA protein
MTMQTSLHDRLIEAFAPAVLEVRNESHNHSVPKGAQTHFNVVVVSDAFAGKSLVARHRAVNQAVSTCFESGLHALAIHPYTADEWAARGGTFPASPPCLGGSKAG